MDKFLHLSYLCHGTGLEQTYLRPYSNKKHHLPDPGSAKGGYNKKEQQIAEVLLKTCVPLPYGRSHFYHHHQGKQIEPRNWFFSKNFLIGREVGGYP